jgi:succinoglycan biosynthesis protein ExoV
MKSFDTVIPGGNFGDDLNPWLWPHYLKVAFDDDDSVCFSGIGSWLHPGKIRSYSGLFAVLGTGAGYISMQRKMLRGFPVCPQSITDYLAVTAPLQPAWHEGHALFLAVRGPRTADALRLSPDCVAIDPAVLLREHFPPAAPDADTVSVMPHYRSVEVFAWQAACAELGWQLIDPRQPVPTVVEQIRGSRLLLSEALHGAIAADALRVRWIPLLCAPWDLAFKWQDFCASVSLPYAPRRVRAPWVHAGLGRVLEQHGTTARCWGLIRARAENVTRRPPLVEQLRGLEQAPSFLSDRTVQDAGVTKLLAAVNAFNTRFG